MQSSLLTLGRHPPAAAPTQRISVGRFSGMSPAVTDESVRAGFMTAWLVSLPRALSTLIGVVLLCTSLGTLVAGAQLLGIGTGWRCIQSSNNDRPGWLRGGLGGMIFGGIAGGESLSPTLLIRVKSSHWSLVRNNRRSIAVAHPFVSG